MRTPFDKDPSQATKTEDLESYFDVDRFKERLHQITLENGTNSKQKTITPDFSSKGSPQKILDTVERLLNASKGSSEKKATQESMTYEQIKQKYLDSSYRILD